MLSTITKNYHDSLSEFKKKREVIRDHYKVLAVYIMQMNKYIYPIKKKFLSSLIENKFHSVDFNENPIYDLLYEESFFYNVLRSQIPVNQNFLNNLAIFHFINEIKFLFPLFIDPLGLIYQYIIMKKDSVVIVENETKDSESQTRIMSCIEKGNLYLFYIILSLNRVDF